MSAVARVLWLLLPYARALHVSPLAKNYAVDAGARVRCCSFRRSCFIIQAPPKIISWSNGFRYCVGSYQRRRTFTAPATNIKWTIFIMCASQCTKWSWSVTWQKRNGIVYRTLSGISEVHQTMISVFVYYLELERRRPKFSHRRLRQYFSNVTRDEDPIKI